MHPVGKVLLYVVEFEHRTPTFPHPRRDDNANVAVMPDGQMLREGAVRFPTGVG